MVCEITKDGDRSPLLPDRQEQGDFFVCDIFDAAPKGAAKAKRLSADWMLPKDWGLWALENMRWDEATIRLEEDKFRDFWVAKAGKDACKNDWLATWRNWCRNSRSEPKAVVSSFAGGI
jgi:hypothetical protein